MAPALCYGEKMAEDKKNQVSISGMDEASLDHAFSDERIVTFAESASSSEEKKEAAKEADFQASPGMRKKAVAAVVAIVLLAAIACAVAFASGAFQTTEADVASGSNAAQKADAQPGSDQSSDDGDPYDEDPAEKAVEDAQDEAPAQSQEGGSVSEAEAASGLSTAQGGVQPDGGNADVSTGQETTGPSSSGSATQPSAPVAPEAPAGITVSFSVVSDAVGSPVSFSKSLTLDEGATVFDALAAAGVDFVARDSAYGKYVAAIGGLAEKQHGGTSGWMYSVNGEIVMTSCSNCVLSQGDRVQWFYTVSS